jgi:excinuclease ABC subunit A
MQDFIKVRGARQHNLQNINLDIPKNKFVVFTGVSGSGKSSLAFDTIYAEGQRRYVESLSAYARQFLGVMDKPDVDLIEGLSPSISIDQKTASHNPRSTVGTITEIYDYLRLLFARIGHPHCPNCGREIQKMSVDEITEKIIGEIVKIGDSGGILGGGPRLFRILSPVVRNRKGEFKDLFVNILSKGFAKIIFDKKEIELSKAKDMAIIKTNKHDVDVIIDTIFVFKKDTRNEVFMGNLKSRLRTAVEQATSLSEGLVILTEGKEQHLFSEKFSCPHCNLSLPELEPRMFSFNSPIGACSKCKGLGTVYEIDEKRVLKMNLSVMEGGILPIRNLIFNDTWYARLIKKMGEEEGISLTLALENLPKEKIEMLLHGPETPKEYEVWGKNRFGHATKIHEKFDGVVNELKRRYFGENSNGELEGWDAQKYLKEEICLECHGDKLKPEMLAVTINTQNIMDVCKLSIGKVISWTETLNQKSNIKNQNDKLNIKNISNETMEQLNNVVLLNDYDLQVSTPIIKEIKSRATFLENVGLGYLTIGRLAKTLSGGELQRIRLASQIGTGLTGVLYVLDEPSIGLHPKDVAALINSLKKLRDIGNSLIVVEHDQETMEAADWLVELGPEAGKAGGKLVFEGNLSEMKKSKKSLTGQYLSGKRKILTNTNQYYQILSNTNKNNNSFSNGTMEQLNNEDVGQGTEKKNIEYLELKGCSQFNLKNIDVKLPLGKLIAVTGVSGSGKSTLIVETLYPALKYYVDGFYNETMGEFKDIKGTVNVKKVYLVDQSPIGRTPRSNPATYVGFFDTIREVFAATTESRARGFLKGRFSFNVKGGRCEKCEGAGVLKVEMQFLADVFVTCDVCHGARYNAETLEVTYRGKTISEVLNMTVDEASEFFVNHPKVSEKLELLKKVGLGYIGLGQSAPTLSGGEAQRIKLADELSCRDNGQNLYILDEPTTGLHFFDVEKLLHTLRALVNRGNTVIVIEHNLDVIKNSDWILDLGPDGGEAGGEVVYQGDLQGIHKCRKSYTGEYLQKILTNTN